MYEINEMPPQVAPELLDLLVKCRTESIGHHREWGCVHGSIKPVMPERRVVGTAVTVACPGADSGIVSYSLNRWLTFEATRSHGEASWRFGLIAFGGFLLTGILMHLFVKVAGLPYLPMQVVTTLIVMIFTFGGHKFFSFADRAG